MNQPATGGRRSVVAAQAPPLLDCADPVGAFQVGLHLLFRSRPPAGSKATQRPPLSWLCFHPHAAASHSISARLLTPSLALALVVALTHPSRLIAGSVPAPPLVVAPIAPIAPIVLTAPVTPTALTAAAAAVDPQIVSGSPPGPRKELLATGRKVFEQHCLVCHGRRGNGRGELARGMAPRPRDFTLGLFKFRSTPSGLLPTDDDLFRTVRGGLAGSAMPAFTALADAEIRAVIEHLKSLSPRWTEPSHHAPPLPLPPAPAWLSSAAELRLRIEQGRPLFARLCAPCHGPAGAGDGPSAAGLADVRGDPCPPRDLRTAPFRRGLDPTDLHRLLLTGLDGSPMPSFAEATTESERWSLVAFVLSLRPPPTPASR